MPVQRVRMFTWRREWVRELGRAIRLSAVAGLDVPPGREGRQVRWIIGPIRVVPIVVPPMLSLIGLTARTSASLRQ
jgi:hypothetical protein